MTVLSHFKLLSNDLDVSAALEEVKKMDQLFNWINLRRLNPSTCHSEVDDIVLRFAPLDRYSDFDLIHNEREVVSYFTWYLMKEVRTLIHKVLPVSDEYIGRVVISKLKPGCKVYPHPDEGGYAHGYDRTHIVLSSDEGNMFYCANEQVHMQPGEYWLFNHELTHWVENNSTTDRIHIIVDIKRNN